MIVVNKLGQKEEVSQDQFNKILATEAILEVEFKDFEGTLEEYYNKAKDVIGEPQYPSVGPEGLVLGSALFTGLREYGAGFVTELLKKSDARDYILYLLIFLSETMAAAIKDNIPAEEIVSNMTEPDKAE